MTLALQTAQTQARRSFWTMARRDAATGYLFIAPQLIGIVVFVLVPLVLVFWYSLHEWNVLAGSFRFTGLANYHKLLSDPAIGEVMAVTAVFSGGLALLNMSLALGLALLLNQKLAFMTVFRTLFFSPVVVSLVAWTIVWSFLLQNNGGINGLLQMIGVEGPNWLIWVVVIAASPAKKSAETPGPGMAFFTKIASWMKRMASTISGLAKAQDLVSFDQG